MILGSSFQCHFVTLIQTALMREIDQLLDKYGESHQNKYNKAIHWIMVPSIFFSIIGLLFSVPIVGVEKTVYLNLGSIALIASLIYYAQLSRNLSIGFILWSFICLRGNYFLYKQFHFSDKKLAFVSTCIFIIAWIFQFIGHKVEGKKPSFLEDIKFLLVGPAWLMHFIFQKLKINY